MKEIDENYFKQTEKLKKKTINDLLEEDEKTLWKGCPRKTSYAINKTIIFAPIAIIWAIIDFGIIFAIIIPSSDIMGGMVYFLIPFFALHLAPLWIWIGSLIKASKDMKNTFYVITNKRILEIRGGLTYIATEINIKDLEKVQLRRSFIDKLLFVGDIYITGKTGSFVMFDIPNSLFISTKIDGLCTKKSENSEFYEDHMECEHCGSVCSLDLDKCPNCGASFKKQK